MSLLYVCREGKAVAEEDVAVPGTRKNPQSVVCVCEYEERKRDTVYLPQAKSYAMLPR